MPENLVKRTQYRHNVSANTTLWSDTCQIVTHRFAD